MSNPPVEPGIPQEMEFDKISEAITKFYVHDVGSIVYYKMLSLIDQMVRDAQPGHPDFHVRFAKIMFQGVHIPGHEVLPRPSPSDIRTLKFLLERVTGVKAAPSFDNQYFPRKIDVHTSYGTDDLSPT